MSYRVFLKFLQGFLLLYAGVNLIRDEKKLKLALGLFLFASLIAALAGIFQALFGFDFIYFREPIVRGEAYQRITGPYKHYNDFGTFLLPSVPLALAVLVEQCSGGRKVRTALAAVLLAVLAAALGLTVSRSAFIGALASILVFSSFFKWRLRAYLAVGVLAAAIAISPTPLGERTRQIFDPVLGSTSERMMLLKTTFAMVKESPLFGLGINTYSDHFPEFRPAGYPAIMYAHNSYAQMAAEIGFAGLFFYMLFIFRFIGRGAARVTGVVHAALLAAVAGLLVNALFESLLQSTQLRTLFWCLLGLAAAVTHHRLLETSRRSS